LALGALAQPCSITIGPNVTICQGQTTTLTGPPGYSNYLWSNGATTSSITVGAAGPYWCQVSYPSGQLVFNGNFDDAGNTGFTTDFNYNTDLQPDGRYYLGYNAGTYHPFFVGWGTGLFLMGNGGVVQNGWDIWCQTVPVCPGQTYSLAFDGASLVSQNPPHFRWRINGVLTGPTFIPPAGPNVWVNYATGWTVPAGVTSASICLELTSGSAVGNDFGVDNISLSGNVLLRDTLQVNVTPLPVVNLGPDQVICGSGPVLLNATVPGGSYLWQNGSTNSTFIASSSGNYNVAVTANNCSNTDAVQLTFNTVPVVNLGNDTTICAGQPLVLNASYPGATYLWQDGSTAATINAAGGGVFSVTLTLNGCTATDSRTVTVNPLPVVNLGNDTLVCPGTAVTFDATLAGATYLWQDGSTAATFTTALPGVLSVTVNVNGCTATDAVTLTNFSLQAVNLGPDVTACAGTPVPLAVSVPGAAYLWSTGATTTGISVSSGGSYWVRTTLNGCTASDTVNVTFTPLPVFDLGNDTTICPGSTVLLDATTASATYLWNNGSAGPTLSVGAGAWSVQVTANGCSATDVISVSTHTPPAVTLGNDTTLCPGATLLLSATIPGGSYLWQDGSTAGTLTASTAGLYSVTVTDANTCTGIDAINLTYAAPVAIDLGNDTTLCVGNTLLLDAAVAGASYLWNTGATTAVLSVSTAGVYSVNVLQGTCSVSDAIQVATTAAPTVDLGNDTTLCPGATLLLDASLPGSTYLWQDGSTANTFTVVQPAAYSVAVTDANGCTGSDAITVQYASPNAVDLGPPQTVCQGTTVLLDATLPGSTYLWSTGTTSATLSVTATGSYWVDVFQGACTVSDTVSITVNPSPVVDLGNDTTLCAGASLTLDATWPGASYLWSTGAISSMITVGSASNVWVLVTLNNCSASDTIAVNFLSALAIDLGADTTLCPGATLLLSAQLPGGSTTWSTGASGASLNVGQAGTYWATVDVGGCSASDTIAVDYTTLAAFDLGPDSNLCDGQTLLLDASTTAGATTLWDDGSGQVTRTVSTGGTFWAMASIGNCSVSDTITINLVPLPLVDLGPDTSICPGATLVLDAATAGGSYLWSNGATTASIIAVPGPWSVTVAVNGCANTDAITVGTLPAPTADLGNDSTLCDGAALLLDVTQPGANYLWQNGTTSSTLSVNQDGTYGVTVDLGGCTASDAIAITYFTAANIALGPDTMLCPGTAIGWSFNFPSATYLWQNGSTAAQYSTSNAGLVWVMAGAAGCMVGDSVQVGITPLVQPDLGADASGCEGDTMVLVVAPGAASVLWSTGATTHAIEAISSGNYAVTLSLNGCTASDVVALTLLPLIDAIDLGADATVCPGEELVLDAFTPDATYQWSTGSTAATLTVLIPGTYSVNVITPCATVQDTLLVTEGGCAPFVHVPNSFTPNGDGINEVFQPVVDGTFVSYELTVFDRWGEAIFTTDQPGKAWDGSLNGGPVQDGVYVWTLRFKAVAEAGVKQERLTGHVTLLR
jgi:gliding motility-associated-like protein